MSSHREAPEISQDPVADSTDVYAFVSPDAPDMVTLIANYIPLQLPDGGPNFYEFGTDLHYDINIDNTGDGKPDVVYRFDFTTKVRNPKSFLYNTGQIKSLDDTAWNRPQTFTVTRMQAGVARQMVKDKYTPPVNVGVRSTPNYGDLAAAAVYDMPNGGKVFAGQRADAFHVDLGSVFDLGGLRPFNEAHLIPLAKMDGINTVQSYNVHTIAVQVPKSDLVRGAVPTDPLAPNATVGVWTSASRQRSQIFNSGTGRSTGTGPYVQVSRLGNPLFNEVLVPMGKKDYWNATPPAEEYRFASYVLRPELASLLPVLYPTVFPNLAAYGKNRADLAAILLTGIPKGVVDGFQNYTGSTAADEVRLNVAVPPKAAGEENPIGLVAGDAAGFPNGRRIVDDVVAIELRAIAGATIPLVDKSFTPDAAAGALTDGTTNTNAALLSTFPYLGLPGGGYQTVPGTTKASSDGYEA